MKGKDWVPVNAKRCSSRKRKVFPFFYIRVEFRYDMSKTYLESLRMLLLPLMLMNGDVNVKTIVLTNVNLTSK